MKRKLLRKEDLRNFVALIQSKGIDLQVETSSYPSQAYFTTDGGSRVISQRMTVREANQWLSGAAKMFEVLCPPPQPQKCPIHGTAMDLVYRCEACSQDQSGPCLYSSDQ